MALLALTSNTGEIRDDRQETLRRAAIWCVAWSVSDCGVPGARGRSAVAASDRCHEAAIGNNAAGTGVHEEPIGSAASKCGVTKGKRSAYQRDIHPDRTATTTAGWWDAVADQGPALVVRWHSRLDSRVLYRARRSVAPA